MLSHTCGSKLKELRTLSRSIRTRCVGAVRKPTQVTNLPIVHARTFSSGSKADFGFKDVDADEKERLVKDVFSKVAEKYDVMNDVMSFGTHRLWKDELVSMLGIPAAARANPNIIPRHLDVAGGTGDIAFRSLNQILSSYGASALAGTDRPTTDADRQIVVCDINPDMLKVGKQRAEKLYRNNGLDLLGFVEGNAERLPFPDASFDLYTIAFGLRNVTNKDAAIREAYRVLRKGGRMLILEFSHVQNPLVGQIYDQFSFNVIPKMGQLVANDAPSYQYLVESIRRFPKQGELQDMMTKEGFLFASYVNFTFGVVAVHSGFKI